MEDRPEDFFAIMENGRSIQSEQDTHACQCYKCFYQRLIFAAARRLIETIANDGLFFQINQLRRIVVDLTISS